LRSISQNGPALSTAFRRDGLFSRSEVSGFRPFFIWHSYTWEVTGEVTPTLGRKTIPRKLKVDSLIEAIFEMRFDTRTIPEILYGRLAECDAWRGFAQRRLPAYDLPDALRQVDANLRYVPVFELQDAPGHRSVKLGSHVLAYHQLAPYVGWAAFKPALLNAIEVIFAKTDDLKLRRLGFRYVNALSADHRVGSISDLDLTIAVEDRAIDHNVNLNFTTALPHDAVCTVRIATTDFVQGSLPANTAVVVDVDVSTKEPLRGKSQQETKAWLDVAHDLEKEQFFRLLPVDTINFLAEPE
jgi:uncharacterized protein (TIGR04255 family)